MKEIFYQGNRIRFSKYALQALEIIQRKNEGNIQGNRICVDRYTLQALQTKEEE